MADCSTIHAVLENLVMEQLMNTMPLELCIWISERKPTTGGEAGRLADDYVQARCHVRGTTTEMKKEMERTRAREGRKCHACSEEGHLMHACPKRAMTEQKAQLSGGAGPDKGTNFTSQLLSELYQLLRVKTLRTNPYHPQTDGLVERFNATLKEMLRKSAQEDRKDWDKLISYVLFAYREVPQESTGFAPFELLYGQDIREPLDILKEEWESSPKSDHSVISHILLMRERLEQMSALAQENLRWVQTQQKAWYNRNARERTLKPGDRVLVLLPTASSKLLAQWQGPYEVVKLVGKANYLVEMPDRRKKKKVLHVNMLKKWNEPVSSRYFVSEASDGEDEMEAWTWDGEKMVSQQWDPSSRLTEEVTSPIC